MLWSLRCAISFYWNLYNFALSLSNLRVAKPGATIVLRVLRNRYIRDSSKTESSLHLIFPVRHHHDVAEALHLQPVYQNRRNYARVKAPLLHRRITDRVHLVSLRLAPCNLRHLEKRPALNHTHRFLFFIHFRKPPAEIVARLYDRAHLPVEVRNLSKLVSRYC